MGIGAVYAHICNMIIAMLISSHSRADSNLDDQCAWYAMNFLIDTTLGLALSLLFLHALEIMARRKEWVTLQDTGEYSGEGSWRTWAHQVRKGVGEKGDRTSSLPFSCVGGVVGLSFQLRSSRSSNSSASNSFCYRVAPPSHPPGACLDIDPHSSQDNPDAFLVDLLAVLRRSWGYPLFAHGEVPEVRTYFCNDPLSGGSERAVFLGCRLLP